MSKKVWMPLRRDSWDVHRAEPKFVLTLTRRATEKVRWMMRKAGSVEAAAVGWPYVEDDEVKVGDLQMIPQVCREAGVMLLPMFFAQWCFERKDKETNIVPMVAYWHFHPGGIGAFYSAVDDDGLAGFVESGLRVVSLITTPKMGIVARYDAKTEEGIAVQAYANCGWEAEGEGASEADLAVWEKEFAACFHKVVGNWKELSAEAQERELELIVAAGGENGKKAKARLRKLRGYEVWEPHKGMYVDDGETKKRLKEADDTAFGSGVDYENDADKCAVCDKKLRKGEVGICNKCEVALDKRGA